MRKHHLKFLSLVTTIALLIAGCEKQTREIIDPNLTNDKLIGRNSQCRLTELDWTSAGYNWYFHYDNKGTTDQWTIDYLDGTPEKIDLTHDRFNRLVSAVDNYYGTIFNYKFTYTGNRLTKDSWTNAATGDVVENKFTYNWRGEIVKQDDELNDIHVQMNYDLFGNLYRADYYLGTDIYFSDNYTFFRPVANPCRTLNGLNIAFEYYGVGFWNNWWWTSNKGISYDNGTATVLYDFDPAKTVFQTDNHGQLSVASYYDMVSGATDTFPFSYENCDGHGSVSNTGTSQNTRTMPMNAIMKLKMLFSKGSVKAIKEQMKLIKAQIK